MRQSRYPKIDAKQIALRTSVETMIIASSEQIQIEKSIGKCKIRTKRKPDDESERNGGN